MLLKHFSVLIVEESQHQQSELIQCHEHSNHLYISYHIRLNKCSYSSDEVINLKVMIRNESSVDVLGATITVRYDYNE